MYKLEELNRKEKEELLSIASEMGIKNAEKMEETELRLTIIDEQASNFASTAATEKPTRKRSRVSVKNVDRVYTASQDKAKKVDKNMKVTKDESMFADLSDEEKAMLATQEEVSAPAATELQEAAAQEPVEPKKRGRKPKAKEETEEEEILPAPAKRGRKPKAK